MGAYRLALSSTPFCFFFFNDTATTEIYTLSLHDALPIYRKAAAQLGPGFAASYRRRSLQAHQRSEAAKPRSEEHTSELQSLRHLVCRLLLEKKKTHSYRIPRTETRDGSSPTSPAPTTSTR